MEEEPVEESNGQDVFGVILKACLKACGLFVVTLVLMLEFVVGMAAGVAEGPFVWLSILFGFCGVLLGAFVGAWVNHPNTSLPGGVFGALLFAFLGVLISVNIFATPLTGFVGASITGVVTRATMKSNGVQGWPNNTVTIIGALLMGLIVGVIFADVLES